jgi:hypothetical protein
MTLFTHETNKRRNTMLEEILVESNARDLIDSLGDMLGQYDVRETLRYSHGAKMHTCECCGGTGVEPEAKVIISTLPVLCTACGGEGNYVTNDHRNPTLTRDIGWD